MRQSMRNLQARGFHFLERTSRTFKRVQLLNDSAKIKDFSAVF